MNWVHVAADTGFEQKFVTIGAASAELGISRDTLRRWERAGRIIAHRLDGKNRYFNLRELFMLRDHRPLTTRQAARALGVSESTVRRMADRGDIAAVRTSSGRRLYRADALQRQRRQANAFCEPRKAMEQGRIAAETTRGVCAAFGMLIILAAAYANGHQGLLHTIWNAPIVTSAIHLVQSLDYR